jgi:hypothetical protein
MTVKGSYCTSPAGVPAAAGEETGFVALEMGAVAAIECLGLKCQFNRLSLK